jgi:predicted dehydrogenase
MAELWHATIICMRFGLVGTGIWARRTHAPALAGAPGIELAAVWGRDAAAAAALAREHGATGYADFDEFLGQVDAVAFAVPPDVQPALAVRAAQAGRHLLLEKPVALTLADADKVVTAVKEAKVASIVFFTWPFSGEVRGWLTDALARRGPDGDGWSGGSAIWLTPTLETDNPFATPWRRENGALWDLGPHMVAMFTTCLGPVTEVAAFAGESDLVHLVLRHESGQVSAVITTHHAPQAASGLHLFIWGAAGRSVMPVEQTELLDYKAALRAVVAELTAGVAAGRLTHPYDVRFGREVTRVLDEAERQL